MIHSKPVSTSIHRPPAPRHALHRAVDGDWPAEQRPAGTGGALVVGLAVVATLPVTAMLLEGSPNASSGVLASIASLPLLTLVLSAIAWRTHHGRRDR